MKCSWDGDGRGPKWATNVWDVELVELGPELDNDLERLAYMHTELWDKRLPRRHIVRIFRDLYGRRPRLKAVAEFLDCGWLVAAFWWVL